MSDDPNQVTPEAGAARFAAATASNIPQIYCNGFANALTSGDVITVLERNGQPVAVVNMSYTVAKTFAQALGVIVADLEAKAGRPMLTTHEVDALNKEQPKGKLP
jgi:hypothetical protein